MSYYAKLLLASRNNPAATRKYAAALIAGAPAPYMQSAAPATEGIKVEWLEVWEVTLA